MTDAAAGVPAAMDAWRQTRYGGPEVVRMERMPVPVPGATDVLLRVRATSVNSGDVKVMRGVPLLIRPASGLRHPRLATRGIDVAGTVASIGSEVTAFAVGDEVMGEIAGGALAEYVVAPATLLTRRPDGLSAADAATLPVAGGTAWQALDSAGVTRGDRVLVIGASGGVGHFAVQLAAQRAAEVWALCGARSARMVGDLGAVRTFDYRTTDAADLPARRSTRWWTSRGHSRCVRCGGSSARPGPSSSSRARAAESGDRSDASSAASCCPSRRDRASVRSRPFRSRT